MPENDNSEASNLIQGIEKTKIYTISKWQKASVSLTKIRIDLDNLLEKEFDEYDRKDERYAEFFESLELLFKNIREHYKPRKKKVPEWVNFKNTLFTLVVAIIATLANNLENIVVFLTNFFK